LNRACLRPDQTPDFTLSISEALETVMRVRPFPYLAGVLALAGVYFGAAKLGLSLASVAPQVTVVWPPTGIALAAVLLFGPRAWPGIALGAFLANATTPRETWLVACGIAVGNTLEALAGAWLLRRLVGFDNSLGRLKDALGLVVLAAGLSTMVSATIGVASLCLGGVQPWSLCESLWSVWWLGDATGDLVVAPVLLAWAAGPRSRWRRQQAVEALALLVCVGTVSAVVFVAAGERPVPGLPLEYTLFPFVIWAALRFGQRGSAPTTCAALGIAIWGTVRGSGPFAGGTPHDSLVLLDVYTAVLAVTALLLAAAITERKVAARRQMAGYAVAAALAESSSLLDAAPRLLRAVCESLRWDAGALWTVDRERQLLRCVEVWCRPPTRLLGFESATRQHTFAPGVGLPGRVWANGRAAWIRDVTADGNFPRAPLAAREGLRGAFASPVVLKGDTLGILEFFSHEIRQPDEDLLQMMTAIGNQVGLFIERRQADEAVRESEERYRELFENANDIIYTLDLSGWITSLNRRAEQVLGYTCAECVGRKVTELIPPEYHGHMNAAFQRKLAGEASPTVYELELICKDGHRVPLEISSRLILRDGRPVGVQGIARDITERRHAEQERREADRRKDEFLAMLAHELRNPLAPLRNALHLFELPDLDPAETKELRAMMQRQVEYLIRLVDDLLDVSRIMRGKIELRKEPLELAEIVARAVETVRPGLDVRGHALTIALPPDPVRLEGDLVRLSQVLANLLNNAIKYTEPGGRIVFSAACERDEVVVRVRDTGSGIPQEMLPRVFDAFVQVAGTVARSQGGLGIGLTLVRRLVELHGGSVSAHSEGPGKGSEFVVRLPLLDFHISGKSEGDCPKRQSKIDNPKSRRVLVVDDSADAALSLAKLLRQRGHEVRVAHDGPSALAAARGDPPEVAFLDIGLPGMDGCELARRLRQEPRLRGALLVALTGWGQEEDRQRTRAAGFDHHLTKPADPEALHRLLTAD
jgi:PAS domain S-box-containing protein